MIDNDQIGTISNLPSDLDLSSLPIFKLPLVEFNSVIDYINQEDIMDSGSKQLLINHYNEVNK